MQQFNFMLTDRQRQRLEEEAAYLDISLSELIRRIIDAHYERKGAE